MYFITPFKRTELKRKFIKDSRNWPSQIFAIYSQNREIRQFPFATKSNQKFIELKKNWSERIKTNRFILLLVLSSHFENTNFYDAIQTIAYVITTFWTEIWTFSINLSQKSKFFQTFVSINTNNWQFIVQSSRMKW